MPRCSGAGGRGRCPEQLHLQVFQAVPSPFGILRQFIDYLWIAFLSVPGVFTRSGELGCMRLIRCTGSILVEFRCELSGSPGDGS